MPKYILLQLVCLCLFVFAFPSPCVAQSWFHEYPYKHLEVLWDWGNSDIPQPDFSRFPPMPTSSESPSWSGLVIADGLDFSGRDLRNARIHLLGGTLRNINFDGANLEGAIFCEVKLENCSFRGANLRHARMIPLPTCDMTGAILGGAAAFLTEKQMRSTWNFKNKDFSNTLFLSCAFPDVEYDSSFNFANTLIFSSNAQVYDSTGHTFFYCCSESYLGNNDGWLETFVPQNTFTLQQNIKFEDFSWNQLPRGRGIRYTAEQAFRTHEFRQKSLHGLTIEGIDFTNCDFSGFTLGYFSHCNFEGANFKDAIISPQVMIAVPPHDSFSIPKCGFRSCRNLTHEQLGQTRFWKSGDLSHLILEFMNLDGWDFSNKKLSYVSFDGSTLRNANFDNARIASTIFGRKLTVEQLQQTRSWKEKRFEMCYLPNINFDNQDLSGFSFPGTRFFECSFKNANLTDAIMGFPDLEFRLNEMGMGEMRTKIIPPSPFELRSLTEEQIRSLRYFHEDMLQSARE